MKLYKILLFFTLFNISYSQVSADKNYVLNRTFVKEVTLGGELSPNDYLTTVSYLDGQGKEIQIIAVKAGGNGEDRVMGFEYDQIGREHKQFLPYAKLSNNGSYANNFQNELQLFYNTAKYEYTQNPYQEISFDITKIMEPSEIAAEGNDWDLAEARTIKINRELTQQYSHHSDNVKKFKIVFENNIPKLFNDGFYEHESLIKIIKKNENWTPSNGKNNTAELYYDLYGRKVLQRVYETNRPHDTYYVYDIQGNLHYILPPSASKAITLSSYERSVNTLILPWTKMVNVDVELAEEYERLLMEYDTPNVLETDLFHKFGGQGTFTLSPIGERDLSLNISFSTLEPVELKTGRIFSLRELGEFRDCELGRIKGAGHEYIFLIRENELYISGGGRVNGVNAQFLGETRLEYQKNYPWYQFLDITLEEKQEYDNVFKNIENEDILITHIDNPYGAYGGLSLSVDHNNVVSMSFNIVSDTPVSLKIGNSGTIDMERRLSNAVLTAFEGDNFHYNMSVFDNQLFIEGGGVFTHINTTANLVVLNQPNMQVSTEIIQGLCYEYRYDSKNRLVEKRIPGKGWEFFVYDKVGRLALTQDANLRSQNKWLFTKYDTHDRVVYTGQIGAPLYSTRLTMQANYDNPFYPSSESRTSSSFANAGININYTNSAYPVLIGSGEVFTVNYYDDYNLGSTLPQTVYDVSVSNNTRGLVTETLTRVLGTNQWITEVIGYDDKDRMIYYKKTDDYTEFNQEIQNKLNYIGLVLQSKTIHNKYTGASWDNTSFTDYYTYDYIGRLTNHYQKQESTNNIQLIRYNKYDELGKLITKKVGAAYNQMVKVTFANTNALQEIDYAYNIRGWLKSINNPDEVLTDRLFSFKINYNTPNLPGSTPLYNRNISETHWKTKTDNKLRSYKYSYDALHRLTNAEYVGDYSLVNNSSQTENYSEGPISYDTNGNITKLERFGLKGNNMIDKIDALSYRYLPYSNKLLSIKDNASTDGFNDKYTGAGEYTYDANGNMLSDLNKGISNITYNHLNLPVLITFTTTPILNNTVEYVYTAKGEKLKKKFKISVNTTETHYNGGFIYQKSNNNPSQLQYFSHPEGYVTKDSNGDFSYVFHYSDHLGNIRLSYTDNDGNGVISTNEIIEDNHYYPFGLKHKGYNHAVMPLGNSNAQKNKFQGKELQDEFLDWYSFDWRNYDPAMGRFFNVDPLAELAPDWTPYRYGFNNPVYWSDPTGLYEDDDPPLGMPREHGAIHSDDFGNWMYDKPSDTWIGQDGSPDIDNAYIIDEIEIVRSLRDNDSWEDFGRATLDFVPVAGGVMDIYEGVRDGDYWQVAIGSGSLLADIFTGGSFSLIKGGIKTGIKQAGKHAAKNAAKTVTAPKGWVTQASKKGGGTVFKDPSNPHNIIRQMPGNPNSPNVLQQNPYVKFMKDGKFYDVNGKVLPNGNVPGAHIPLNQFNINNMPKF